MHDLLEFLNLKMLPILLAGQLPCGVVVRCECSMSEKWGRLFFLQVDAAHLLDAGVSWRYTRHLSCMFV